MSYENTSCPCGGKKKPQTMICDACEFEFADTYEFKTATNESLLPWERRSYAIRLLSMSRRRNKRLPLSFLA